MKSRLRAKIRKWLRKLERRRKLKELYRMYKSELPNILRPEDREEEERRIKKGLAAGVLLTDDRARLIDVKPRLEARVKQW